MQGARHTKNDEWQKTQPSVSEIFVSNIHDELKARPLLLSRNVGISLVEHNVPISAAYRAEQLFENMFADSKITKEYQCTGTKTLHIVDVALSCCNCIVKVR